MNDKIDRRETQYKRRDAMTESELRAVAAKLRNTADARVRHADAMEAYIAQRFPPRVRLVK